MRTIELNSLQLNAVTINSAGERWRGSHAGAPPVVPDVPTNPDVDENGYIIFEDAEVARICAENWGDGTGVTLEQAAAVKSIGTVFKGNTTITSFNELSKFQNVEKIEAYGFTNCSNLEEIDTSRIKTVGFYVFQECVKLRSVNLESVTSLGALAFQNCKALENPIKLLALQGQLFDYVFSGSGIASLIAPYASSVASYAFQRTNMSYICLPSATSIGYRAFLYAKLETMILGATPPSLSDPQFPSNTLFYVPSASVSTYREAAGWVGYASRIFPISQLEQDNNGLFKEIYEYIKDML